MPNNRRLRRIAAHYVYFRRTLIRSAVVEFDAAGTVTGIDVDPRVDRRSGVEFYNGILVPGLVNAHTHLELSYLTGAIPPGSGFTGFAAAMRQTRGKFSEEDILRAAAYQDSRMYAEGVSLAGDVSNSGLTVGVKTKSGISYRTFLELYGLHQKDRSGMAPLEEKFRNAGLVAGITPHSTYSLNERAFHEAVGEDDGYPLSIHFMESPDETQLFRGKGPMRKWYDSQGFGTDFTERYGSPAERIIENVPPDRKVLFVHNTFITESDVRLLSAHFGHDLTWVLCPRSNLYISGTLPPVGLLRSSGCRIAVGTDSLASNTSLSMLEEMKLFCDVPLEETLAWVTVGGAQALGGDQYGSFETGKAPGAVVISGIDWDNMKLTDGSVAQRVV